MLGFIACFLYIVVTFSVAIVIAELVSRWNKRFSDFALWAIIAIFFAIPVIGFVVDYVDWAD